MVKFKFVKTEGLNVAHIIDSDYLPRQPKFRFSGKILVFDEVNAMSEIIENMKKSITLAADTKKQLLKILAAREILPVRNSRERNLYIINIAQLGCFLEQP